MSQRICSVDGCEKPHFGRGWCNTHYSRWRKAQLDSGHEPKPRNPSPEGRFWEKVQKTESCWLWLGARSRGYGQVRWRGKLVMAHRVSWEMFHGRPVPEDLQVDHLCHDPHACTGGFDCPHRPCVNPEHLEAVTPWENKRRSDTWEHLGRMHAAKTHCPHGHEYTSENTYLNPSTGYRSCIECYRGRQRARHRRDQHREKA